MELVVLKWVFGLGLVVECASAHQADVLEDCQLARDQAPLKRIAPLE